MTNRHRRALAAAAELNRRRRPREHVYLPDAHDPTRTHRVDGFILDLHRQTSFGLPVSDEYDVTGWQRQVADRAQNFERGTIYLDSGRGNAGFFSWNPYVPLAIAPAGTGTTSPTSPTSRPPEYRTE